jgi:hypothetical protein
MLGHVRREFLEKFHSFLLVEGRLQEQNQSWKFGLEPQDTDQANPRTV